MKSHLSKAALLAALGLGSVTVAQAQLSGTYTSGDLLVGFTSGTSFDLIYDLGQASSLSDGETWSGLQSLIASDLNNVNGFGVGTTLDSLLWGVVGSGPNSGSPRTLWTTVQPGSTPNTIRGNGQFAAPFNAVGALAENFSAASTQGASAQVDATTGTSWNQQTTYNSTLSTSYVLTYENPNTTSPFANLYSVLNDGSTVTPDGGFTLGSDNSLTYSVASVPEPSSLGFLGGAGLLILAFRTKLSRKQA